MAKIDVFSWATPNGHKVHIMLEECGLPYEAIPVNIGAGEQFRPEFLAMSPNNKIPAIVDPEGPDGQPISVFESGAILVYLAGKTGRFLPKADRARYEVLQWLMFQMGGIGLGILALGLGWLTVLPQQPPTWEIVMACALCGVGFGSFQSPNNHTIVTSAPLRRAGAASGMLGSARLTGQSLGAVLLGLIFSGAGVSRGCTIALGLAASLAAASAIFSSLRLRVPPAAA